MKYTFFDVETANCKQSSICAIGYIVFENYEITNQGYYLVKPEPFYMDYFNTKIHGITKEMVENEPTFDIVWEKIKQDFEDTTLVAHFAQFDTKCLREVLDAYQLNYPNTQYTCTYTLARRGVKGLFNYKLDTLAQYYGIEFEHHNAFEDTKACYEVLMNILRDNHLEDIEELHKLLKVQKGYMKDNREWKGTKTISLNHQSARIDIANIKPTVKVIDENNEFFEKEVVFTGTLERMPRKQAMQMVVNAGGYPNDQISKHTDYLVIGKSDFIDFTNGKKTNKLRRAEELIEAGQDLEIVDETDFYRMMGEIPCTVYKE